MKRMKSNQPMESPLVLLHYVRQHSKLWISAVLALTVLAGVCFAMAVLDYGKAQPGWQEIPSGETASGKSQELTLLYDVSGDEELKAVSQTFAQALGEGEQKLSLATLNAHPGEAICVSGELYRALEILEDSRYLYYAPVYEQYRGLYGCSEDVDAAQFDPAQSPEILDYLKQAAAFAADPAAVKLELLGDKQVELRVSPEYAAFVRENEIGAFVDFFWLENAFLVDYVADRLADAGFEKGVLSSFQGFARTLGHGDYAMNLTDRVGRNVKKAAQVCCDGPMALVVFRDHPVNSLEGEFYYVWESGEIRTPFIDPETQLCKSAAVSLLAGMEEGRCGELAVKILPVYRSEHLEEDTMIQLSREGIAALWIRDGVLTTTARQWEITPASDQEGNRSVVKMLG